LVIGLTVVTFGNVVGSNISTIGIILGITAMLCPVKVNLQVIRQDGPIMRHHRCRGRAPIAGGKVGNRRQYCHGLAFDNTGRSCGIGTQPHLALRIWCRLSDAIEINRLLEKNPYSTEWNLIAKKL
jgi:hypothetical protein